MKYLRKYDCKSHEPDRNNVIKKNIGLFFLACYTLYIILAKF